MPSFLVAIRPSVGCKLTNVPHSALPCLPPSSALKTKHETPKYGLIYHASLIGQSSTKFKGKISRVLAAKCALAVRVDALGDSADASIGLDARAKVEARMRQLEGKTLADEGAKPKGKEQPAKYDKTKAAVNGAGVAEAPKAYNAAADVAVPEKKVGRGRGAQLLGGVGCVICLPGWNGGPGEGVGQRLSCRTVRDLVLPCVLGDCRRRRGLPSLRRPRRSLQPRSQRRRRRTRKKRRRRKRRRTRRRRLTVMRRSHHRPVNGCDE